MNWFNEEDKEEREKDGLTFTCVNIEFLWKRFKETEWNQGQVLSLSLINLTD